MDKKLIKVEVVYSGEEKTALISLLVTKGTTVLQAILQSGILEQFPRIAELQGRVGIFSKIVPLDTFLKEGDRVEIYRDLKRDPKEARRKRAKAFKAFQRDFSMRATLSPLKSIESLFSMIGSPFPGLK